MNVYDMHIKARLLPQSNIALMKLMFGKIMDEKPNMTIVNNRVRTRGDDYLRSSWFHRSVTYQGPSRWLALPNSLKKLDTIEEFSKAIKEWYLKEFIQSGIV